MKENFFLEGNKFLENLYEEVITKTKINKVEIDHLCYRVSNNDDYYKYKKSLGKFGELLSDDLISGREISTFKLKAPFEYKNLKVFLLELPSVKEGSPYEEGYEHMEMVIDETFESFMDDNSELVFITKDIAKPINPDIQVQYQNGKVKFHHQSLEVVIEEEQKLKRV